MSLVAFDRDPKVGPIFWVAELNNGLKVFEDIRENQKTAWSRLLFLLRREGWRVTTLHVVTPDKLILLPARDEHDGFFTLSKIESYVSDTNNFQIISKGVGFVRSGIMYITWVNAMSGELTTELRKSACPNLSP